MRLKQTGVIVAVLALFFVTSAFAETELPVFNGDFETLPSGITAKEALVYRRVSSFPGQPV